MNNIISFLLTFCIFFNSTYLNASAYDNDTLEIFSKILPRFVLMSSQENKIKDKIDICVLYDTFDENTAILLINKVKNNYPNGIKNFEIKLRKNNYSDIESCKESQLAFMFNTNKDSIKKAIDFSNKNSIITISYDEKLLQNGVDVSLFLGRKVIPYINVESLKIKSIELNNVLLRISKIYKVGNN